MGYKTSTHCARVASVGSCLGSPFRLLIVLGTVTLSSGCCPRSIPSKQSVPLFIYLPPPPSVRSSSRSAPISGPVHSPSHTLSLTGLLVLRFPGQAPQCSYLVTYISGGDCWWCGRRYQRSFLDLLRAAMQEVCSCREAVSQSSLETS
jgi:hypothetical protein